MNKFAKKNILQKTILVILMILSVNFIVPTYSSASIGGVLINPILDLGAAIGDVVESLLQWCMTGQAEANESIFNSNIMVDQGDSRINNGGNNPTISVTTDELDLGWFTSSNNYQVPIIKYTPEEIFSNKVPYLDINFIAPKWTSSNSEYSIQGSAARLQDTISGWYVALRNLSIVGLLCVLVYVGIRIILSSTSADKAKYKQMFTDWIIALCLLFFLHYIMSFTLVMIDSVNDAISGEDYTSGAVVISVDGTNYTTNFMGAARFMVQSKDTVTRFAYLLIYIALVTYTAVFTWHYLKRLLMMAFLTIIAPLVALTYPIDKIGDGKAQAFSMWLKEYVYNALIQPFHLIIYMVFVGSAMELAKANFIYAVAAIAFILPAEKILKKMFGFDRAPLGTMGALTGFTVGSLASKLGGGKSSKISKAMGTSTISSEDKPPRYQKHNGTTEINYMNEDNHMIMNKKDSREENDAKNTKFLDTDNKNQEKDTSRILDIDNKDTESENQENRFKDTSKILDTDNKNIESENQKNRFKDTSGTVDNDMEYGNAENEKVNYVNKHDKDGSNIESNNKKVRFSQGVQNIVSAHGGAKQIAKRTAKSIGGAAKFATKTAFTLAGMSVGAGAGIASGKGLTGIVAGATAGKSMGRNLGKTISETPENIYNNARNITSKALDFKNRTIDEFNGNTERQEKARTDKFMKDSMVEQYIRDKMTAENNGMAPKESEIKLEKESMRDYVNEGLTDVAQIYRAKKAESFGVSSKQSAKIAALANERKITSKELGDEKQYNAKLKDFTQEYLNKGMNEENAQRNAEYILNVMKAQVGQQHNLNNPFDTTNKNSRESSNNKTTSKKRTNKNTKTSSKNKTTKKK